MKSKLTARIETKRGAKCKKDEVKKKVSERKGKDKLHAKIRKTTKFWSKIGSP